MKVSVAMSGGVDSSVVAGLLVEQGHEVIGVPMKLHDAPSTGTPGRCCGFDDALDARVVAARLDIPFFVMDLREAFRRAVMDDLADNYLAGRTPNPCVMCNGVLKFQVLLQRSPALGCSHLATGHYARLSPDGRLRMATDADKDQSYLVLLASKPHPWGWMETLWYGLLARFVAVSATTLGGLLDGARWARPVEIARVLGSVLIFGGLALAS